MEGLCWRLDGASRAPTDGFTAFPGMKHAPASNIEG